MGRAVLVEAPGRHRVIDAATPRPGAGEALVRVVAAGICGSDREVYAGTRPAPFVKYPIVPGHEWSGRVESVGPDVPADLAGSPVVGEGFRACLTCERCRTGDTNLCAAGYEETGFTCPGAFADHLLLPARLLHVLSQDADLSAAALIEPAACVAAAVAKALIEPGARVAVVGAGTLGMLAIQLIAAYSPAELLAVDARAERAELAVRSGASRLIGPGEIADVEGRYDVVLEAAGVAHSPEAAVRLARRGGRIVLTGIPRADEPAVLPVGFVVGQQLTVATVFGAPSSAWVAAVRAFNAGILDPAPLVTHEFSIEEYGKAIELMAGGDPGVGKILLRP